MVNKIKGELEGIQNSLQIMKMGLHWWDGVEGQIDDQLKEIQGALANPTIDPQVVEHFRKQRERLWQLTDRERADNIANAEKILPWVKGTAVVGIGVPAFYFAWEAGLGALITRSVATLVRKNPIQTIKQVAGFVSSRWQWVRAAWYRRWAPVPLGIGYGSIRNYFVARKQEQTRDTLKVEAPSPLLEKVKTRPPSWADGLKIVEQYPHDQKLMEYLLPGLYRQTVTPEAALVLTHVLLEIFSLSPFVDAKTKNIYGEIMEREFHHVLDNFGKWVMTLGLTQALESEEGVYEGETNEGKIVIRGYPIAKGVDDALKSLLAERIDEKKELSKMMDQHMNWLEGNLRAKTPELREGYLKIMRIRKDYVERATPLAWGATQAKISQMEQYIYKVNESFVLMGQDFQAKNPDIWQIFAREAAPARTWSNPTGGQFLGWFGGSLFVGGSGPAILFKSIPFGIAGGFISASYTAEELAKLRQPIILCLPSYGAMCERLPNELQ